MTRSRFITLEEANLKGKRVLLRVDFNVALKEGKVTDDSRIRATLPTIKFLHDAGAAVAILSHLGSPKTAEYDSDYSLAPVASYLSEALDRNVPLIVEWLDDIKIRPGEIVLLENIRFASGEKSNTDELARKMATLCDVYVNEAFASARREQSSVHGIAKYLPVAYTGPLFVREVDALSKVLDDVAHPLAFLFGGMRRPETKFDVLSAQLGKADNLMVAGVLGNTFLKASGKALGKSVYLPELLDAASDLLQRAERVKRPILIPVDVVCGTSMDSESPSTLKSVDAINADEIIMDIGPETIKKYSEILSDANTIVWSGPMGVVEIKQFSNGTSVIASTIAASDSYSIANGGDTLAYINSVDLNSQFSHLSTGGGSSLEFMQGKQLPAVVMMEESARVRYAVEREY